jgi:hypothetical protein
LILEKYGRLTAFYGLAPAQLGVSTQTLKRFIGSGKPSRKELARKMLALLGEDMADYGAYFTDEGRRKNRPANNREVIGALILKIEELQQKVDNLANTINLYHRWDSERNSGR